MTPIESYGEKKETQVVPSVLPAWERLLAVVAIRLPTERFIGVKTVLGVSGGADSVAMLRLVLDLWERSPQLDRNHLVVAHFNHKLRGQASDGDQSFTVDLAKSLRLSIETENAASAPSTPLKPGGEASFRAARYRFLQKTAETIGARCVLVAHSADDNIETMLHHLFRGAGPAGLSAIAPHRPLGDDVMLIRPLLALRREELRGGLAEIGQPWREDASNLESRYQRNWLRGELLPMIRERYPNADQAILRAIESQSRYREKMDCDAVAWIESHVICRDNAISIRKGLIDIATLSACVRLLWDRMQWPRQSISEPHLRRILSAITESPCQRFTLPGDIQCEASNEQVTLTRGRKLKQ
jgi:tRNA(Ile)-lysidine synthase